jgi:hypothetical protein
MQHIDDILAKIDRIEKFKALTEAIYRDTGKYYGKGNKCAAVRARKSLLALREFILDIRKDISSLYTDKKRGRP